MTGEDSESFMCLTSRRKVRAWSQGTASWPKLLDQTAVMMGGSQKSAPHPHGNSQQPLLGCPDDGRGVAQDSWAPSVTESVWRGWGLRLAHPPHCSVLRSCTARHRSASVSQRTAQLSFRDLQCPVCCTAACSPNTTKNIRLQWIISLVYIIILFFISNFIYNLCIIWIIFTIELNIYIIFNFWPNICHLITSV